MYRNLLLFAIAFSALTYLGTNQAIARGERGEERGGEHQMSREGGGERGMESQRTYQGGGYSDYGHSYSQQDRAAAAYGVGREQGYNTGSESGDQNVQYVPYQPQQQQQTQPAQPYPYTEQPYQPQ